MLEVTAGWKTKVLFLFIGIFFLVSGLAYIIGIRINNTASIPLGIYRLTEEKPVKGDYVMFCPPKRPVFDMALKRGYIDAGFCSGQYGHIMKRVLGVAGDHITVTPKAVTVNGHPIANSAQMAVDLGNSPMPVYQQPDITLGSDQFLLMGENPISFDARYFGLINRSQINGVIHPLFTWKN
ncbi:MAG: conjugative transfer signal peptidase TraF [Endozoicomonas sp. (ex Botrylloides leachii)]|nr:conjugative transfer signal peptidase TraF [Endozoicomonas sp. (ex Botrylloides leachii)]